METLAAVTTDETELLSRRAFLLTGSRELTLPEDDRMLYPIWTSDDARIAFAAEAAAQEVQWKSSANTGEVEPLAIGLGDGLQGVTPYFFADGDRLLVYREQQHAETGDNIRMVSLDGEGEPVSLLASRFSERSRGSGCT